MTDIQALNAIIVQLGGSTAYKYNIDAYNAWAILQGGTGGHRYDIDALNEIDVLNGGSGGHKYDIDALNSIIVAAGGTGGYKYINPALAALATLLNQPDIPDGAITTKNGDMIVLTTGGDYILTVEGFIPLNALRTTSGDVVKTKELDFITI